MSSNNSISELIYTPSKDVPFSPLETFCGLFPIGEVSMITAQAGVGKSWLVRYCMNQASIGQDIYGNDAEVYSSLCFSGEDGKKSLERRDRLTRNCNLDTGKISYITTDELMKNGITPALLGDDSEGFKDSVQAAVTELGVKALFFDSLVSFNGGEENSTGDMSELFGWLSSFAESNNIAVVLSHHMRKQGKDKLRTIDDVAGNSVMIRKCKTIYYMENVGGTSAAATGKKGYVTELSVRQLRKALLMVDKFIFTLTTKEADTDEITTEITDKSYITFQVRDADGNKITPNNQENKTKKQQVHTALKALINTKAEATSSDINTYVQDVCNIDVSDKTIREVIRDMLNEKELTRLDRKRGSDWVYRRPEATAAEE